MARSSTLARRFLGAALGVVLVAGGGLALGTAGASASDGGMAGEVNASRSAQGLGSYSWNGHLAAVAQAQAQRMADKHLLYHNPNLADDVGDFRWVGENVGYGPSSEVIEDAFMHSPEHRANILDHDYTQIGIGSVRDSKGRLWVAQVFREPLGAAVSSHHTRARSHVAHHVVTVHHSAPVPTPSAHPAPAAASHRPQRPHTHVTTAPHPAPAPTLAERVSSAARSRGTAGATDPLASALAFAATMHQVAG